MAGDVALALTSGQPSGATISESHIEEVLRRFGSRFREDFPSVGVFGAIDSGRAYVSRALRGSGLEIPPGSITQSISRSRTVERDFYWRVLNVTVAEPPEGSDRSIGGRRRSFGREVNQSLAHWAAKDFENAILAKMREAKAQSVPLEEFARSLTDGKLAEVAGRKVMANIAHAEQRAQKFAEELMYQDIDEANPGRLKLRFTRVGSAPCEKCGPLQGRTFSVNDAEKRRKYRVPQHPGCRCNLYPVVDGDLAAASFFQRLATRIDEVSEPVRPMFRTAPNLAAFVEEAKASGAAKSIEGVSRVGRRAMEDIREELARQPGFKEKEATFRAAELEFKEAETALRVAEEAHRQNRDFSALRVAQEQLRQIQDSWLDGRRDVAEARTNATLRALKRGGIELGGEQIRWHPNTPKAVRDSISRAAKLLPRSWLENLGQAFVVGEKSKDERAFGYYPESRPGKPSRIVIGGLNRFAQDEVALHELAHPVELANPVLRKRIASLLDDRAKFGRLFADSYLSHRYPNGGTEVLSAGLESVYFSTRRTWTDDEELLGFLIGAMLTL